MITDHGEEFEQVKRGYQGKLTVEIAPRAFSVIVRAGMTLNQLRFLSGNPKPSDRATAALEKAAWQREEALVYGEEGIPAKARIAKKHVTLSVNLRGADSREVVAYKAKKNTPVIDLANIDFYDPEDFWDVKHDLGNRGLILEAGGFYILASEERGSGPPDWAGGMFSLDQDPGEFRIHYAGFFDPGVGDGAGNIKDTRAVLEDRAHEGPFLVEHSQ